MTDLAHLRMMNEYSALNLLRALQEFNGAEEIHSEPVEKDKPRVMTEQTGVAIAAELAAALTSLMNGVNGKKNIQEPVADPAASGDSVEFISSVTQNAQGVLTPRKATVSTMRGATTSAAGGKGLVPGPEAGAANRYLAADGTWKEMDETLYSAGDGLSLNGTTFYLPNKIAAGTYGPSADVNGAASITIPQIKVDKHGRIESITLRTYTGTSDTQYTAGDGLSLSNGAFSLASGVITAQTKGPSASVTGSDGTKVKIPKITVDTYGRVTALEEYEYTSVNTDTNTTYSAGTGLSLSGTTFSLASGVITAKTKGATQDVTGSEGQTIKIPKIQVDTYGRVIALEEYTYTSKNSTYSVGSGLSLNNGAFSLGSHAATGSTYGLGNASYFGHVKLHDAYNSSGGAAVDGVAASSKALYDLYCKLFTPVTEQMTLAGKYSYSGTDTSYGWISKYGLICQCWGYWYMRNTTDNDRTCYTFNSKFNPKENVTFVATRPSYGSGYNESTLDQVLMLLTAGKIRVHPESVDGMGFYCYFHVVYFAANP